MSHSTQWAIFVIFSFGYEEKKCKWKHFKNKYSNIEKKNYFHWYVYEKNRHRNLTLDQKYTFAAHCVLPSSTSIYTPSNMTLKS